MQVRKHGKAFRDVAAMNMDQLGNVAQTDATAKHLQVIKLELEAALKLEQWDDMDELFDQCWKYNGQGPYETLADLVLIIHSSIVKASLDRKYQSSKYHSKFVDSSADPAAEILSVLQRIINITTKQNGNDATKLARWIRCLFQLSLTFDESVSLRCVEQATTLASNREGVSDDPFPSVFLFPPIIQYHY